MRAILRKQFGGPDVLGRTINGSHAEYTRAPVTTRGNINVTLNLA